MRATLYGARTIIAEDIERAPIGYDRVVVGFGCAGTRAGRRRAGRNACGAADAQCDRLGGGVHGAAGVRRRAMPAEHFGRRCRDAVGVPHRRRPHGDLEPHVRGEGRGSPGSWSAWRRTCASSGWRTCVRRSACARSCAPGGMRGGHAACRARSTDPDAPAVVLFTSGSEGAPKGVVLSHRNLLANCAQIASVIDFHGGDIVFNAMPMFHAFGLTGGTILPLVSGVRTFHYPSPLHYRDRAGADLRHRRDDLLRHRHVPERLGALCPSVRLLRHALHLRRRREGAGGDQASVRRPLRRARPGRLWRHRNVAGARTEHGDAVPSRHGGALPARDRVAARVRSPASRPAAGCSCAART